MILNFIGIYSKPNSNVLRVLQCSGTNLRYYIRTYSCCLNLSLNINLTALVV